MFVLSDRQLHQPTTMRAHNSTILTIRNTSDALYLTHTHTHFPTSHNDLFLLHMHTTRYHPIYTFCRRFKLQCLIN
jgi:hypothetical protein